MTGLDPRYVYGPEPFYRDGKVVLYCGDYREILGYLRDARPSPFVPAVVITDPPYGETSLEWDRWPDGWPELMTEWVDSMWVFGSMRMFLDHRDEFAEWKFAQDIVWEKHNGSNLAADRFSRVHEHATHWYRGKWADLYRDVPTTPDATARTVRKKGRPKQWIGATGETTYVSEDGGPRLMRSVQYVRSMHGQSPINETQKPLGILEPLIHYSCPPDRFVLDPFAGSGSTLVAARNVGRYAVGIEKREEQCEKAAAWLAQDVLDFGAAS